jgi:hypothetical protein
MLTEDNVPAGKLRKKYGEKINFFASLKSLKRGALDLDPHQNVTDPQHYLTLSWIC